MRTAVLIAAIVVFLFGFIMEYGAWLFAWFSRLTDFTRPPQRTRISLTPLQQR